MVGPVSAVRGWPGVLLTPETLATYEELVPGAAERMLKMAEAATRGEYEVWADGDGAWIGFSTFLAVVIFGLAVGGVGTHATLVAGGFFMSVPALAVTFAWVRWSVRRRERAGRRGPEQ